MCQEAYWPGDAEGEAAEQGGEETPAGQGEPERGLQGFSPHPPGGGRGVRRRVSHPVLRSQEESIRRCVEEF